MAPACRLPYEGRSSGTPHGQHGSTGVRNEAKGGKACLLDEAQRPRPRNRLGAAMHVELAKDILEVPAHGAD